MFSVIKKKEFPEKKFKLYCKLRQNYFYCGNQEIRNWQKSSSSENFLNSGLNYTIIF